MYRTIAIALLPIWPRDPYHGFRVLCHRIVIRLI
jgi:hypothetical protein